MTNQNRRNFIRTSGAGILAGTLLPALSQARNLPEDTVPARIPEMGLASYTTKEFSLEETISMCRRVDLKHLGLKSFHLPLDATDEACKAAALKIRNAGIDFYSAGVIYMNNKEEVDNAFRYAAACGIRMIIGVPAHDWLTYTEEKVKETGIIVAIHNHGPGDLVYPTVAGIAEKIEKYDSRIGICMDIGHTSRLGLDPTAEFRKYFNRILEIHIKDEDRKDADGQTIEIGRGVIDIPGFLKEVLHLGYKGILSFEFEKDPKDPLPGLAESVGYVRGVLASIG
jgi:inosose dehydratase